jgi:predicted DNA-binding ribbon-helix-helix protein
VNKYRTVVSLPDDFFLKLNALAKDSGSSKTEFLDNSFTNLILQYKIQKKRFYFVERNLKKFSFSFSKSVYKSIKEIASTEKTTTTEVIRRFVEEITKK